MINPSPEQGKEGQWKREETNSLYHLSPEPRGLVGLYYDEHMAMSILYAHRVKKYEKIAKKQILKFSKSAIKQRFCYHFEVVKV